MSNELKDLLRSVLKEELEPITKRLDSMEGRLDSMEGRLDNIEQDVKELKAGQEKMYRHIVEDLGTYTERISDYVDDRTDALNKRVYAVEIEIQRLAKQEKKEQSTRSF